MPKHSEKIATQLLKLEQVLDACIERALRARCDLKSTLNRLLPTAGKHMVAARINLSTRNEELAQEDFVWQTTRKPAGPRVRRRLDVAGESIGHITVHFASKIPTAQASAMVRILAEELDAILFMIHTAREKQALIERVTRALTREVFTEALDDAVRALARVVPFDRLAIVHLEESGLEHRSLDYRLYRAGRCTHDTTKHPHAGLDEAIVEDGVALLSPDRHRVARVLDLPHTVETLFLMGITEAECLGQLVVSTKKGLDTVSRDLLTIFANAVAQRLIDYRRERQYLAEHFSRSAVDRLLAQKNYREKLLAPRTAEIGILYADINSFTQICEKSLKDPHRVGTFVDLWAREAVRIVKRNGGVYDKMVGDCIIALFGPPFFKKTAKQNARNAMKAAKELQAFTIQLEKQGDYHRVIKDAGLPGLGVAIGVNLCPAVVGLFGATKDYTAFSSGMNQTARLQSLGGFREILAMDRVRKLIGGRGWSAPRKTKVKNVAQPLRYNLWQGK